MYHIIDPNHPWEDFEEPKSYQKIFIYVPHKFKYLPNITPKCCLLKGKYVTLHEFQKWMDKHVKNTGRTNLMRELYGYEDYEFRREHYSCILPLCIRETRTEADLEHWHGVWNDLVKEKHTFKDTFMNFISDSDNEIDKCLDQLIEQMIQSPEFIGADVMGKKTLEGLKVDSKNLKISKYNVKGKVREVLRNKGPILGKLKNFISDNTVENIVEDVFTTLSIPTTLTEIAKGLIRIIKEAAKMVGYAISIIATSGLNIIAWVKLAQSLVVSLYYIMKISFLVFAPITKFLIKGYIKIFKLAIKLFTRILSILGGDKVVNRFLKFFNSGRHDDKEFVDKSTGERKNLKTFFLYILGIFRIIPFLQKDKQISNVHTEELVTGV